MNDSSLHTSTFSQPDFLHAAVNPPKARNNAFDENRLVTSFQEGLTQIDETCSVTGQSSRELVLKIRVANTADPDFVEVELPRNELTYQALLCLCCKELDLNPHQIQKLRKLPNTRLRRDKDVQRLQNLQEIEVITDTTNVYKSMQNTNGIANSLPTVLPANGYQSISKKDQTILY